MAKKLRELLNEKDPHNSRIASMISSFELAANISELYNQLTLNMTQLITWQNIDKLEVQVKKTLSILRPCAKPNLNERQRNAKAGRRHSLPKKRMISLDYHFVVILGTADT